MSTIAFRNWTLYHIICESDSCLAEYVGASLLCNKLGTGGMQNIHNNIRINYFDKIGAEIQGDISSNLLKTYDEHKKDFQNALSLLFPTAATVAEAMLQVLDLVRWVYNNSTRTNQGRISTYLMSKSQITPFKEFFKLAGIKFAPPKKGTASSILNRIQMGLESLSQMKSNPVLA